LLDARDRSWVEQTRAYDERSAARLMMQDVLVLRDSQTVADAVAFIRRRGRLPAQTDRLFVVDSRNILIGRIGLGALIIADADAAVTSVMDGDVRRFRPTTTHTRSRRRSSATTCSRRPSSTIAAS
jgi:magnesium transporter